VTENLNCPTTFSESSQRIYNLKNICEIVYGYMGISNYKLT
jgi:hypothetical protein